MARLSGKIALITGAGRGQGAAQARLFAKEGARVHLCDVLDTEGAEVAGSIRGSGDVAEFHHLDVTSADDWSAVIGAIERDGRGLHVLVNNAGIAFRFGIMDTELADWDRLFAVNLRGIFTGIKLSAPLIRQSGGGSILNIESAAGMTGHFAAAYSATKWGLRGLSKTAAMEFVDWNIRVNMLHPGAVDTPIVVDDTGFGGAMQQMTPMRRMASPDETAAAALFLVSDDASFITGADLPVDGGLADLAAYGWISRQITRA
jgi:3alpha(or 20beta)-hydroxysteroid dehydrogenase